MYTNWIKYADDSVILSLLQDPGLDRGPARTGSLNGLRSNSYNLMSLKPKEWGWIFVGSHL